jgi:hypothetical protein
MSQDGDDVGLDSSYRVGDGARLLQVPIPTVKLCIGSGELEVVRIGRAVRLAAPIWLTSWASGPARRGRRGCARAGGIRSVPVTILGVMT